MKNKEVPPNVKKDDFIIKNKRKYFKMSCNLCGKDKGYKNPESAHRPCYSCNGKKANKESLKVRQKPKPPCIKEGCEDSALFKGMCQQHYDKFKIIRKQLKTKANIEPRTNCLYCSKEMETSSSNRKYCSESCNSGAWRKRHPDYSRERYRTNINAKLASRLRNRIWQILNKNKSNKVGSAVKDLGCSLDELKIHLESMFKDGMSWENYGDWEIDHVIPLSIFNLSDKDEFNKACHYSNLQPLWARENKLKSNKI